MSFTPISLADYMDIDVPPTDYLVDGLIVEGAAVLFSAREKAGKGLLMLELAVSIASGSTFLDRPVKEGAVFYLALEEHVRTVQYRLRQRCQGHNDIPLYIFQLDGSMEGEDEFRIDSEPSMVQLATAMAQLKPSVVIIDTLREAHQGRENEADDMAPRLRGLRSLAHNADTTIIVTHHAAKLAGGARGSTAIRAAFDDVLEFTRNDSDADAHIRGVLHAEGRNVPKVTEHIQFNGETFQWDATSAPPSLLTPNLRTKILEVLNSTDAWLSKEDITEAIPEARLGTVQNQLSRMVQEKPAPFAVDTDKPVKGKPRRYHGVQAADIPHQSSHTKLVTNEETEEGTLVDTCDYPYGCDLPADPALGAGTRCRQHSLALDVERSAA